MVSANCRSGPQEISKKRAYGPLVPVGDDRALAEAILKTLEHPLHADLLRMRAGESDIHPIANQYLQVLLPD